MGLQYYGKVILGRVAFEHKCEANAGNFSPRRQTNMRKLRLSLPNLREIFNVVKFRRAYILERSLFQTTKARSARYYRETNSDPNQILMGRVKIPEVILIIIFSVFKTFWRTPIFERDVLIEILRWSSQWCYHTYFAV